MLAKSHLSHLLRQKSAATLIQCMWRRCHAVQCFLDHKRKIQERNAVIALQHFWRQAQARKFVACAIAALQIQCAWRQRQALVCCNTLRKRREAALTIQAFWKRIMMQDFEYNAAASIVQKAFRGYWYRVQFLIDILDIIAVQSCVRRFLAYRERARLSNAVQKLQNVARIFLSLRKLSHQRYLECRMRSARRIQTCFRQYLAKRTMANRRKLFRLATTIQGHWRKRQAEHVLAALKIANAQRMAVVIIQSAWRTWKARLCVFRLKKMKMRLLAAEKIQAFARQIHAQKLLMMLRWEHQRAQAATCIQALWKGRRVRFVIRSMWCAAVLIQQCTRRFQQQRHFANAIHCATRIQAVYRSYLSVKTYTYTVRQIMVCQSAIRQICAKAESHRRRGAVLQLQCFFRRILAQFEIRKLQYARFHREAASITIQRYWRGYHTQIIFHQVKQDAVVIQSAIRGMIARRVSNERREAITYIQSIIRVFLACKLRRIRAEERIAKEKAEKVSVVKIQALYRGVLVRQEFQFLHGCAQSIQRAFRGHAARVEFFLWLHDIIVLQSLVRRWTSKQKSKLRLSSIIILQCFGRGILAKSKLASILQVKHQQEIERRAAITIQRVIRGTIARKICSLEFAARQIQKTWRCYTIHVEYMFSILAAIDIQAAFRRYVCRKRFQVQYSAVTKLQALSRGMLCRMHLLHEERCAVLLQSVLRMFLCRLDYVMYLEEVQCATSMQAFFRMHSVRAQFFKHKIAVLTIQRYVRGFIDRLQLETEHFASTEIARLWRGHEAREKFAWCILSAMKMQSVVRMFLEKKRVIKLRSNVLAAEHLRMSSARKLQRSFRAYKCRKIRFKAACIIQRSITLYLSRIMFGKIRRGILKAQATFRGILVRRIQPAAVKALVARIKQANEHVRKHPERKLGNRTHLALRILQTSRSLSEIMDAVCILEIATRLSEVCCESFVLAGASEILFSLIRTCNRSLPHVKLLHGVLLTMCNVAQYCHLLPSMAKSHGVEILLDLVQMFRDKEHIFCLVITLLERAVQQSQDVVVS